MVGDNKNPVAANYYKWLSVPEEVNNPRAPKLYLKGIKEGKIVNRYVGIDFYAKPWQNFNQTNFRGIDKRKSLSKFYDEE